MIPICLITVSYRSHSMEIYNAQNNNGNVFPELS